MCIHVSFLISACSSMAVEIVEPLKVDLRIYNNLLNSVPQNAVTIPLMLHCMAEQVYIDCCI